MISAVVIMFFLVAYFVPFIYTGEHFAGTDKSPVPESEIYGSVTCIVLLHLVGYYNDGPPGFVAPGIAFNPPQWNWVGTLSQDGHYYFFCDPYSVPVPSVYLPK